jgi:PPP family 3-phenylpropionic acid transporter
MMYGRLTRLQTPTNGVIAQLMALMFFSSIGRGFGAPYVNLYLDSIGVSATVIGTIVGIASLVELLFSPFLNNLADRYKRHRLLLVFQYAAFALGTFFVAMTTNIWFLGLIVMLIELGKRSAIVLSLQLTLIRLEQINRDIIGRMRAVNAFGFSLSNIFQGPIFLASGFLGMFMISGIFTGMSIWFMRVLPKQATTKKNDQSLAPRQRKFYFLVLIQVFVMLGQRSGFAFWLIHFTNNLGVYVEDIGILIAIWAFAEVPFFILFDSIIRRFDVRITYMLGASGMGVMWFLVSIVPSPAWLIPILLMRGLVFSMLNLSTLMLISRISDPRNVATNQSLLQITVPGLAMLIGAPLMGWFFDTYPAYVFFGLCMMFMFVGSLIMLIVYRYMTPTLIEADNMPENGA